MTGELPALATHEWGSGDRVAVLLHGQVGDGLMWWEVAPALAARGYRVIAVDLPGHGRSPADPRSTLASAVEAVLAAVPDGPELAVGHSLGGMVLAHAVTSMRAARAVYVDVPLRFERAEPDTDVLVRYRSQQAARTLEWLRRERPHWSERDREVEAAAARRWDPETSVSLVRSLAGLDHRPATGIPSLAILPDPSDVVPPDDVRDLRDRGVAVRTIPGAGHSVWYGHVPEFLAALDSWLVTGTAVTGTAATGTATAPG